jgi:methionyl-tRNA synthetase
MDNMDNNEEKKEPVVEEVFATIDDFAKLDIRICKIMKAERIEGADKLLRLTLDEGGKERIILAGIAQAYMDLDALAGRLIPVIVNLAPRVMKGETSHGMMLAPSDVEGKAVLLSPISEVPVGAKVK